MDLPPRQLRSFLAVAKAGGFTAAARELGLPQSVVSDQVRELERALSVRLFQRSSRSVGLTEAGRAFQPRAAALLADMASAAREAQGAGGRGFAVAAPPLLAANLLPGVLAGLRLGHPGTRLRLMEAPSAACMDLVRQGEADIAVGTFAVSDEGDRLERLLLATDALALFMPREHPLAAETGPLPWKALAAAPLVSLTPDSALRGLVDAACRMAGLPVQAPDFEVGQIATAVALVAAGLGLAALPGLAAPPAGAGLVARPLVEPAVRREIVILRRRQPRPAGVAAMMGELQEGLRGRLAAVPGVTVA